jgi:hypothetical protein
VGLVLVLYGLLLMPGSDRNAWLLASGVAVLVLAGTRVVLTLTRNAERVAEEVRAP